MRSENMLKVNTHRPSNRYKISLLLNYSQQGLELCEYTRGISHITRCPFLITISSQPSRNNCYLDFLKLIYFYDNNFLASHSMYNHQCMHS